MSEPTEPLTGPADSADDPRESLGARFVRALLDRRGVPRHRQATLVAEILGLGYTQAHRRLTNAAPWVIDDLARVAEHLGTTLSDVVGEEPGGTRGVGMPADTGSVPASWVVDGQRMLCELWLGEAVPFDRVGSVVARRVEHDVRGFSSLPMWEVLPRHLAERSPGLQTTEWHAVRRVCFAPDQPQRYRVAVLDDDRDVADTLSEQFRQAGLAAQAFYSAQELSKVLTVQPFEAYVLDWVLDKGTARSLVEAIRAHDPHCPIAMLTGQLISKRAEEAEVVEAMQAWRLMFYEKPVRGLIVAAALRQALVALPAPIPVFNPIP